jgi:hypothetical protein
MTATTSTVTTPLAGPSLTKVWKPPLGVTPGSAGDATAPFKLNTRVEINDGTYNVARFARVAAGGIAADATTGITSGGVTTTAAANNTYLNGTGVALIEGDYAFFMGEEQIRPLA